MIKDAKDKGLITPGKTVLVETTSGNTGIGLAFTQPSRVTNLSLSCKLTLALKEGLSLAFGAELHLTDPAKGHEGVLKKTNEILSNVPNSYLLHQLEILPT